MSVNYTQCTIEIDLWCHMLFVACFTKCSVKCTHLHVTFKRNVSTSSKKIYIDTKSELVIKTCSLSAGVIIYFFFFKYSLGSLQHALCTQSKMSVVLLTGAYDCELGSMRIMCFLQIHASRVTFIYIALYTIHMGLKQLLSDTPENNRISDANFINYE